MTLPLRKSEFTEDPFYQNASGCSSVRTDVIILSLAEVRCDWNAAVNVVRDELVCKPRRLSSQTQPV